MCGWIWLQEPAIVWGGGGWGALWVQVHVPSDVPLSNSLISWAPPGSSVVMARVWGQSSQSNELTSPIQPSILLFPLLLPVNPHRNHTTQNSTSSLQYHHLEHVLQLNIRTSMSHTYTPTPSIVSSLFICLSRYLTYPTQDMYVYVTCLRCLYITQAAISTSLSNNQLEEKKRISLFLCVWEICCKYLKIVRHQKKTF